MSCASWPPPIWGNEQLVFHPQFRAAFPSNMVSTTISSMSKTWRYQCKCVPRAPLKTPDHCIYTGSCCMPRCVSLLAPNTGQLETTVVVSLGLNSQRATTVAWLSWVWNRKWITRFHQIPCCTQLKLARSVCILQVANPPTCAIHQWGRNQRPHGWATQLDQTILNIDMIYTMNLSLSLSAESTVPFSQLSHLDTLTRRNRCDIVYDWSVLICFAQWTLKQTPDWLAATLLSLGTPCI